MRRNARQHHANFSFTGCKMVGGGIGCARASSLLGLLASQSNCVLIPAQYFHFQGGAVCALSLENENGGR
jgi:hypothetical protein